MAKLDGAEVAKHSGRKSCWIVIDGKVYDVTSFLPEHPGGATILLKQAGAVRSRVHHVKDIGGHWEKADRDRTLRTSMPSTTPPKW